MQEVKPSSWWHWLIIGVVVLYALLLLIAPIAITLVQAFANGLDPIIATFQDPNVQNALSLTFFVAFVAVVVNGVFGVILAWVLVRQKFWGKGILNALVDVPFVFSPVIAGYVLISLFGRNGWFSPTPFPVVFAIPGIILAKIFVTLPFVTREVGLMLAQLDLQDEEAAISLGASRWRTFWRVVFPGIRNGVLYGLILTFARALGEFGAVTVAGGSIQGRTETATVVIFRLMQDRNTAGAYSLALLLGLSAILIMFAMQIIRKRLEGKR